MDPGSEKREFGVLGFLAVFWLSLTPGPTGCPSPKQPSWVSIQWRLTGLESVFRNHHSVDLTHSLDK